MLGVNLLMNFFIYDIIYIVKSVGIIDVVYIIFWIGIFINDIGFLFDIYVEKFGCKNIFIIIIVIDVLILNFLVVFIVSIIGIK